ncbi:hypothetical protein [Blautia sp. An46]|nr:hypothetical protein [Blautia sp. An46]
MLIKYSNISMIHKVSSPVAVCTERTAEEYCLIPVYANTGKAA